MKVSVLVPFRTDEGRRDALRDLVASRTHYALDAAGIDHEIVVSDDRRANHDLFNRGQAINLAARDATGDVLVIHDADTTYDSADAFARAVESTLSDRKWRLPTVYAQLTEAATDPVLQGRFPREETLEHAGQTEWVGVGICWSGLVIVPREAFELVGGGDERYIGWGADDVALGLALDALYGRHVRYPGAAIHLWHPRGTQENGWHRNNVAQRKLTERYQAAADDPAEMLELVAGKRL